MTFFPSRLQRSEWLSALALVAVFFVLLAGTWRRWADPFVDFGREVYVPWRLSEGDLLYRDVFYYYGPLAAHINALAFRVFGASLTTLFVVNSGLSLACLLLVWRAARRFLSPLGAAASALVFLAVSLFGHLTVIGNFNFLSPYSHEITWGFFVCLCGLWIGERFLMRQQAWKAAIFGALGGLAALCKTEIFVAYGCMALSWAFLCAFQHRESSPSMAKMLARAAVLALAGFGMVVACACLYFATRAGDLAASGLPFFQWAVAAEGTLAKSPTNLTFMGLDDPVRRLVDLGRGLLACTGVFMLGAAASLAEPRVKSRLLAGFCWLSPWAALGIFASTLRGGNPGPCLPAAVAAGLALGLIRLVRGPSAQSPSRNAFLLLWSAWSLGMALKLGLYPRLHHYGFVLGIPSALLGLWLLAGEGIAWIKRRGGNAALASVFVWLLAGAYIILSVFGISWRNYRAKVEEVGHGPDRLFYYSVGYHVPPRTVGRLMEVLGSQKRVETLAVLPEGAFLNYLTRKRTPTPDHEFTPPLLALRTEKGILSALERSPPDLVVVWSRRLGEFGVQAFGGCEFSGVGIWRWIQKNYELVYLEGLSAPSGQGAALYRRKNLCCLLKSPF